MSNDRDNNMVEDRVIGLLDDLASLASSSLMQEKAKAEVDAEDHPSSEDLDALEDIFQSAIGPQVETGLAPDDFAAAAEPASPEHIASRMDLLSAFMRDPTEDAVRNFLPAPHFRTLRMPDSMDLRDMKSSRDGMSYGFVRVGAGETVISLYHEDEIRNDAFVVDSGWSEICRFPVFHGGSIIYLDSTQMVHDALSGKLMLFGEAPDLSRLRAYTQRHIRRLVSHALDTTVGRGDRFSWIALSGPSFLDVYLENVLDLRPNLRPEATIEDLNDDT